MSRHTVTPREVPRLPGVAAAFVVMGACAPGYSEAGYLLHEDASYEEVFDTSELFGPVSSTTSGLLALDSGDLPSDRNYLRYRIIVARRYYTVHGRRDPRIPIPPGSITLGVQSIDVSSFVSGTRARYGIPRQVSFAVAPGETVHVVLGSDGSDELRIEVVQSEGRSRRDSVTAARDRDSVLRRAGSMKAPKGIPTCRGLRSRPAAVPVSQAETDRVEPGSRAARQESGGGSR